MPFSSTLEFLFIQCVGFLVRLFCGLLLGLYPILWLAYAYLFHQHSNFFLFNVLAFWFVYFVGSLFWTLPYFVTLLCRFLVTFLYAKAYFIIPFRIPTPRVARWAITLAASVLQFTHHFSCFHFQYDIEHSTAAHTV
jgi:hypothetical protein